jgi:signal peptidase II
MGKRFNARSLAPFILSLAILVADQLTKLLVVLRIPVGRLAWSAMGDVFWLVHQKNTGAAFSLGDNLPEAWRVAILIIIPIALLAGLCFYMLRTDELNTMQRWAVCGVVGGGMGNLVDRIFRPDGVVDFLSFKFYGLFGLERWPTFNIADAAVVICSVLLVVSGLFVPDEDMDNLEHPAGRTERATNHPDHAAEWSGSATKRTEDGAASGGKG